MFIGVGHVWCKNYLQNCGILYSGHENITTNCSCFTQYIYISGGSWMKCCENEDLNAIIPMKMFYFDTKYLYSYSSHSGLWILLRVYWYLWKMEHWILLSVKWRQHQYLLLWNSRQQVLLHQEGSSSTGGSGGVRDTKLMTY